MKRMIILIAVIFLLLGITGCGNSNSTGIPYNTSADPAQQNNPENHKAVEKNDIQQTEQNESGPTDKEENNTMKISVKSANYEMIYKLNNSQAAKALYAQLPLTMEVKPFSSNEMTFYPTQKLDTSGTPLSGGETGSLSYYEPWGDIVMFYAPCDPNSSLYELGTILSGKEDIDKLNGTITISVYKE